MFEKIKRWLKGKKEIEIQNGWISKVTEKDLERIRHRINPKW